jgi:N6-adenosine-specific RNA methylase IME4
MVTCPGLPPFRAIVADPPWMEQGSGKCKRGADRHYPLLRTKEIPFEMRASGVWRPNVAGCHLYLWATNNHLEDGLFVMDALGFRYVTNLCWEKVGRRSFGLGYYFRGSHELCLFGVMGKLRTQSRSLPTLFKAERGRHSEKPTCFYTLVEQASPAPRLEMFARAPRPGWVTWGNELEGKVQP